jgi:hypothetical protein
MLQDATPLFATVELHRKSIDGAQTVALDEE